MGRHPILRFSDTKAVLALQDEDVDEDAHQYQLDHMQYFLPSDPCRLEGHVGGDSAGGV